MESHVGRGSGRGTLLSNALRQAARAEQSGIAPLASAAPEMVMAGPVEDERVGLGDHDYAPGREDIGRYETASTYDLDASAAPVEPLPVDPMRWTMVQDVLEQLGGPIDPEELNEAAGPLMAETAAEPVREQIDYDDPAPEMFKRFDGSALPPDPTRSGHTPPKQAPGPSMLVVVTGILSVIVAALGIWIVIDFFHAL